uniref:Uncharacterized protein n=1 Tax=Romanomermis culicivorax TaxID=13658 RepID=A0A915JMA5_ROMCU
MAKIMAEKTVHVKLMARLSIKTDYKDVSLTLKLSLRMAYWKYKVRGVNLPILGAESSFEGGNLLNKLSVNIICKAVLANDKAKAKPSDGSQ